MQHLSGKRSDHSEERRKFKIDVANLRIDLAIPEKKPEAGGLRAQQSQLAGPWKSEAKPPRNTPIG